MKSLRVTVCAGAIGFSLFSGTFAAADAVDDLLAGKPVIVAEEATASKSTALVNATSASEKMLARFAEERATDEDALSHDPLEVKLSQPTIEGLDVAGKDPSAAPMTTAHLSLVPEPSAIALSALSLVYFLIFFRRRYAF